MAVEIALGTPLSDALNAAIQPKLVEVGWASAGADDSALSEYIILMLVNGKTQDEISSELAGDLLSLGPDDPGAREFSRWLFEQIGLLNAQLNGADQQTADGAPQDAAMGGDTDTEMNAAGDGAAELNAPTGPRSMRNGNTRGGREKRVLGHINRALDRSHENVLHRVRGQSGNERIGGHGRTPPTGPRGGTGRQPRATNTRMASVAHGLANMGGMPPVGPAAMNTAMPGMNGWMGPGQPAQQSMDIYSMLEQQNRLMQQMQQQLMMQQHQQQPQGGFSQNHGKPLSERIQRPHGNFRRGGAHQQHGHHGQSADASLKPEAAGEGEDVEMSLGKRDPPNPEDSVCKYNLRCTNKDCKFAHQSPAAPPGITVDVKDVCSFGVACKNRKCVGRHPSPATKVAHQGEQDCKFFPNCQNPQCPFRHPSMPPCRNGGDCAVPNCKFTHVQTKCKFNPCTNRFCMFKHEEGQRGTFQDKVWVADGPKENISERKFVDENAQEEMVLPESDTGMNAEQSGTQEVTT